jgi:hypothetical protein
MCYYVLFNRLALAIGSVTLLTLLQTPTFAFAGLKLLQACENRDSPPFELEQSLCCGLV